MIRIWNTVVDLIMPHNILLVCDCVNAPGSNAPNSMYPE